MERWGIKNAARITKFYGTTAKKGDDLPQRPHRPSKLIDVPEDTKPVSRELLAEIAAMKPQQHKFRVESNGHREEWDLSAWISAHNVATKREGPWGNGGYRYILEACPWNGHTDDAAFIVCLPHGPIAAGCHHDSCQSYGWPDLREHYEPGAYDRRKNDSANNANSAKGDQNLNEEPVPWTPPAAFHSYELPEFPHDVFPAWMAEYTNALAEATQTPRDLAGMLGITVGAVVSAKLVQVEVWDGWTEPANIFTVTALRSGSRKTTVFERICAPVEEYEALLIEETAAEIAEQRTKYRIYEGRLKKAEQRAAKSEGADLDILTADAMQAAADPESITVPAEPRLLIDDATPERIAAVLAEQGGRIALMSAEGGVFDMMAGRYSQGIPNLDIYLKAHAGDALRVDRVGRAPDFVRRPALTTGLAVQPDVLRGLASRPGFRSRGLLGRYLYAMPHDTLGSRRIRTNPVPRDAENEYRRKIRYILGLSPKLHDREREPHTLRFSAEAQDEMEQFMRWIEPRLADGAEFGDMTDWAGKLAGAVARIAGILHMLDFAGKLEPWEREVSADTVRRAIKVGHYLILHAKYALAFMGSDPTVENAKYILRCIDRTAAEWFTKRDAFEGTKGRFGKVSELEPGLDLLVAHGYVREDPNQPQHRGPGRKPSPRYEVNPLIRIELSSRNSHYLKNVYVLFENYDFC